MSVLYLLQRTGLIILAGDKTLTVNLPDDILPPMATAEVWVKDVTTVIDLFKKTLLSDDPTKRLCVSDIKHVIDGSPVKDASVQQAFNALATTVTEINVLTTEENSVRQAMDILRRDVSTFKNDHQLRMRFVLELSAPALKAAASRVRKAYPCKPANYDKMKKKEREACGWNEWTEKWVTDILAAAEAGTLVDNYHMLQVLAGHLKAESAHAAWRLEASTASPRPRW